MNHTTLLILTTLIFVSLLDYIPRAFIRIKKPITPIIGYGKKPEFIIMPTVYGNISYLQNVSFLKKYSKNVVICTSKYETKEFYSALRAACRQHKFRYICVDLPFAQGKPIKNAYTIYEGAFGERGKLGVRKDTPCLLIDADTYSESNVNNLVRTFLANKLDIASLRCEVSRPQSAIQILQALEYRLAMDNRRMDPWLTSGACNIAKFSVFQKVFSLHSHFFIGGDIEIGKIAQVSGYKIKYIDFTFYTAAPDTFKAWFKQRVVWFAGGVRHHVTNIGSYSWHHFFIFFYNSLIVYLLFPLRWVELLNYPLSMLALLFLSWLYVYMLVRGTGWKKEYMLLPFYGFTQSMIILPLAYIRYVKLAWGQRSLGLLRYDTKHYSNSFKGTSIALNVTTAGLVIYVAFAFTATRIVYWWNTGLFFSHIH